LKKKSCIFTLGAALVFALACGASQAHAQDIPTAVARIQLYGWGGVSGNFSGVALAHNLDVAAGVDLEFRPFFSLYPALELRGLYPIDKGQVVAEKNALIGIRLARHVHPFTPYGDALFGRGQLNFLNGGYPTPSGSFFVLSNTSNVLSFGAGTDYALNSRFALKGDFQFQRYASPVTTSGYIYSKVFTVGVVYRIGARGLR
jgi:Outer membrane protein beta-barrel domain